MAVGVKDMIGAAAIEAARAAAGARDAAATAAAAAAAHATRGSSGSRAAKTTGSRPPTGQAAAEAAAAAKLAAATAAAEAFEQDKAAACREIQLQVEGSYSRAVFVFDYGDSDLFHVLEDTMRKHNAKVLGLTAACSSRPATSSGIAGTDPATTAARAGASGGAETSAAASARSGTALAVSGKTGGTAAAGGLGAPLKPTKGIQTSAAGGAVAGAESSLSKADQKAAAGALKTSPRAAAAASGKHAGATHQGLARAASISPSERRAMQTAAAGGGSNVRPALATASSPGMQLQAGGTAKGTARAHFADVQFGSWSDCSGSDEELTECDLRLQEVLAPYKGVLLDNRLLQV